MEVTDKICLSCPVSLACVSRVLEYYNPPGKVIAVIQYDARHATRPYIEISESCPEWQKKRARLEEQDRLRRAVIEEDIRER